MVQEKVVLAYSGGLDSSVIVRWLANQGYEVIALCLDLGQKVKDLEEIRIKGLNAGASQVILENVQDEFVREYVFPSIQMNAVYEGIYLLGTSLARPLIAKKQIACAKKFGATTVAHGATGKGNDQLRFEMAYLSLMSNVKIIAPWKLKEFYLTYPGRSELLAYAKQHGIPVKATKAKPWSSDENLMHISFESGMLEDPWKKPLPEMYEFTSSPQDAPDEETKLEIEFVDGIALRLNGVAFQPAELLHELNRVAGVNGIGRIDIVESRFVGMKCRGVYETPGGTVLFQAHRAMESVTLTSDVISLKDSLMPKFAQLVYNGFWFSRQMELILGLIKDSQKGVTGTVRLELYKGNVLITGRKSPFSLYDKDIASMEKDMGNYNIEDANGFIRLNALPHKLYYKLHSKN